MCLEAIITADKILSRLLYSRLPPGSNPLPTAGRTPCHTRNRPFLRPRTGALRAHLRSAPVLGRRNARTLADTELSSRASGASRPGLPTGKSAIRQTRKSVLRGGGAAKVTLRSTKCQRGALGERCPTKRLLQQHSKRSRSCARRINKDARPALSSLRDSFPTCQRCPSVETLRYSR